MLGRKERYSPAARPGMNETFWQHKNVAVTGGSGFIGLRLVRTLASVNATVHILDICPPRRLSEADQVFHQLDLRNLDAILRVLKEHRPKALIHLAGQPSVSGCHENPIAAFEKNVVCTYSMLEACRLYGGLQCIVVVSSNHVYGRQKEIPTGEDAALNGTGIYATSKLCGDVIARAYGKTYGLPVSIARVSNSYGEDDPHTTHIITGSIISALKGEAPIIKQSGKDTKGYLYVQDTVDAILTLAEQTAVSKELYGEPCNFAPDISSSVKDLVHEITSIVGRGPKPVIQRPMAAYEEEHLDNLKAKRVLDWIPQYSLRAGLTKAIAWYREHGLK